MARKDSSLGIRQLEKDLEEEVRAKREMSSVGKRKLGLLRLQLVLQRQKTLGLIKMRVKADRSD